MKFAENNRISQRQLYRQIVIAFIAPLILCLFENRKTLGLGGLAGTAAALAAVLFYVIFLIRLRYAFARPCKTAGVVLGRLAASFFLIYCILGAAFLLNHSGRNCCSQSGNRYRKKMALSDHIAGLQSGHAKGDSETRQNGRSVRRRGTCSGYLRFLSSITYGGRILLRM